MFKTILVLIVFVFFTYLAFMLCYGIYRKVRRENFKDKAYEDNINNEKDI